jgi:hypothetical protein
MTAQRTELPNIQPASSPSLFFFSIRQAPCQRTNKWQLLLAQGKNEEPNIVTG